MSAVAHTWKTLGIKVSVAQLFPSLFGPLVSLCLCLFNPLLRVVLATHDTATGGPHDS
jgi:hypothetical protein